MIYLDFWIIGLLLTWRDYETKSLGWGVDALLSAPIEIYQVSMQPRPWLERSDPEPLEVTGSHGKGRNVFLPSHSHTPIETNMRQGKKVER